MKPLDPIAVALSGSQLVEASAGTGKTYAIATLYVRLLLEARLNVAQILVVTYTNAATAELRLRIRKRLRDTIAALDAGRWEGDETLDRFIRQRCALGDEERQRDRLLLLQAVHAFDEAAIFTIHGFCERVLRENAFESGAAFETELLADVSGLVDEIVKDFWVARLHDAAPEFVRYLTSKGEDGSKAVIPEHLTTIAARVLTYPDIEVLPPLPAEPVADETLAERVLRFQREFVDYARHELRRRKDAARVQSFDDLLQRLRAALAGPGGEDLAEVVRRRYHAALIDEFQDTDPVQYDIFRRLYGQGAASLFLIGDPKQAIYGFRGADVFTYMDAKRDATATHTLLTNRRSDPSLLRAINTIFEAASPAFLFEEIGYDKLEPPPGARERLGGSRRGHPPFEILFLRRDANVDLIPRSGLITKPSANEFVTAAVASRIVAMLQEGVTLLDGDVERPLASSDIAVLCRKNVEAQRIQESLRQLGVHAVLQTDASVFETAEAVAVERTLRAMADPADNRTLRAALSSSLIGLDAAGLAALESDEQQWDGWARYFREWHDRWLEHGFIAAFRSVLDELEIERQLLALPDGERRLTDVLHLAELLHRAGVEQRLGPEALIQWLARMRTDMTERSQLVGEAGRIRLESDEAAVKLVTIHRSKGLEYPVVFCPFSWDGTLLHKEESRAPRFHDRDDGNRLKLDLGSPDLKAHKNQAEYEALAENLRLLYVAFTRARHYCGVVWGAVNGNNTAALTYLLSPTARAKAAEPTKRAKKGVKPLDDDAMIADLQALASTSDGAIGVVDLRVATVSASSRPAATAAPLQLPPIRRREYSLWRTSSFSGLIAASSTPIGSPDEEGIDHDAALAVVDEAGNAPAPAAPEAASLPFADVRRGARTGDFVHRVLEKLDFQIADTDALRTRLDAIVPRTPTERASFESLVAGIDEILDVPLGGVAGTFKLRQLPLQRRLNELEFILPVAGVGGSRLTVAKLAAVFARHAVTPTQIQYAQRLEHLGFTTLEGYLKGFVDLVFEHAGKWYVVDYKTNFLGPSPSDYVPEALPNAMAAHHYPLQYHLYTVALHRYLSARMPGYDYDTCFGGVYYLFLRGMSPRFPAGNGIWHDRPRRGLVEDLAALFAQPTARGDRR